MEAIKKALRSIHAQFDETTDIPTKEVGIRFILIYNERPIVFP